MSLRELNPGLAKKAREELGEDPTRIPEDLQAIKDWLSKQRHINARTDDQWLIAFLRGCKYSLERTKEKLDNYYTMKSMVPEITKAFDINDPTYIEISKSGSHIILPKLVSDDAPTILLFRPGNLDLNRISLFDSMRFGNMLTDLLILEDDNTVVAGQRFVIDMKGMKIGSIMAQMTPSNAKKMVFVGQDSVPVRQKGAHYLYTPPGVETIFALIKTFMNEKNKQRIFIHNEDMEALYKFVPREILPTEYGGYAGSISDMNEHWRLKLDNHAEWFKEHAQYKTDESKRPGKPKTSESLFGVEGSFRQLNVD